MRQRNEMTFVVQKINSKRAYRFDESRHEFIVEQRFVPVDVPEERKYTARHDKEVLCIESVRRETQEKEATRQVLSNEQLREKGTSCCSETPHGRVNKLLLALSPVSPSCSMVSAGDPAGLPARLLYTSAARGHIHSALNPK